MVGLQIRLLVAPLVMIDRGTLEGEWLDIGREGLRYAGVDEASWREVACRAASMKPDVSSDLSNPAGFVAQKRRPETNLPATPAGGDE